MRVKLGRLQLYPEGSTSTRLITVHGTTFAVGQQHPSIYLYHGNIGLSQGYTRAFARSWHWSLLRCVLTSARGVAEIEYISGVREHRVDREVDGGRSTVDTTTLIIRRPTPTVVRHSWKSSVISTVGGLHRTAAGLSGSTSN